MTLEEWVATVCAELGIETPDTGAVLDFARDMAHNVARPAAPLTCMLVGLAATSTAELPQLMDRIHRLLPTDPAGTDH